MSILKVARMGHPVLRSRSPSHRRRATSRARRFRRLIDDMLDTMIEYHGVGLAAPQMHEEPADLRRRARAGQAGSRRRRSRSVEPIAIVNPEITPVGDELVEDWEGCLSIPDIRGRVPRAREIRLRALRPRGPPHRPDAARIFPPVSPSTKPIISTASFFSIACGSFESLTFLDEYSALLGQGLERALATA